MATKEEVLQSIRELAENNSIAKEDIMAIFESKAVVRGKDSSKKINISDILYYVGGAIVFFGIVIFVGQNWNSLNTITRIVSTLGSAVVAFLLAVIFSVDKKTVNLGLAFHFIAALLLPTGLFITFHEAGYNVNGDGMQALISCILFAVYMFSFAVFRKSIFSLFSIIFGTWLYFSFTSYMVGGNPLLGHNFTSYRFLLAGLTYISLGYYFSDGERKSLSGFLYGFGILGFLGSTLALGGWKPNPNMFWEIIYPGLIFLTLLSSVYIKSKSFLTFGTIFLMAYISKITAEYFSNSIGWPLSLVLIGLFLIASGYLFIHLSSKYMKKNS